MPGVTQWAGVALNDRRAQRRKLLVECAFDLFGTEGEAGVSVRAVCRQAGLNSRYFYQSFADVDELLGAVYDRTAAQLAERVVADVDAAGQDPAARLRAGMRQVLRFCVTDPRRGRVLFTEARANATLAARRERAELILLDQVLQVETQAQPGVDPLELRVRAALFTGAMVELALQWLGGSLGDDLDTVLDAALAPALSILAADAG